jgi:hypothetical protein
MHPPDPGRVSEDVVRLSDRFSEIKDPWSCQLSDVGGRPAVSQPPVECAAVMADSKRPHLAQTDLKFLRYLEKRVLVVELRDPHTRRLA